MIAPAVWRCAMPQPALRLTWLANALEQRAGAQTFVDLLRRLDPGNRVLRQRNVAGTGYALALVKHLSTRFPVYEPFYEDDGESDIERVNAALYYGIPIECLGVARYYDAEPCSPAICLCLALYDDMPTSDWPGSLDSYKEIVAPLLERKPCDDLRALGKPPRGRAWIAPWGGVHDLACYALGATDCVFLDHSQASFWESYSSGPPWNMDEIRSLEAEWRRAKPIHERAVALAQHIDAEPEERLPLLAGALCRDRETLYQLTRPERGKTLAEVFTKDKRKEDHHAT